LWRPPIGGPGLRQLPHARMKTIALLTAGLAFVALLGFGMTRDPHVIPSPLVGEVAPSFHLPRLDGADSVSLTGLAGKVVVVNFWASWCLACQAQHPALVRAWDRYRNRGVVFVGVNDELLREQLERLVANP
jgi:cytochrome c biogenesis protein CcmG, thiol:disulfide interchange protein DsbE